VLGYTREVLIGHLQELPALVDLHQRGDADFPGQVLVWLGRVEATLGRLRNPLVGLAAGQRSALLAAGERRPESPQRNRRSEIRAAASRGLGEIEAALRQAVLDADARLAEAREKIVQLVAIASAAKPLSLPTAPADETWLTRLWRTLGENPGTETLYAYLNASLRPADRHYLLQDLLANAWSAHAASEPG
jgi:hypothetical protein